MPGGVWHDDGVYLLLGKSLAQGEGLRYGGVVGAPPATKFPPAYPLVVAATWRLTGPFPGNARWISALNVVLMAGAGVLFALVLHAGMGLGPWPATLIAGLAWLSPDLWRVAAIPLSEPLFMVALMATLLAACRAERAGAGLRDHVLLLLGFAVLVHVRTIGVAAGAGVVGAALLARRWREAAGLAVAMVAVLAPWALWTSSRSADVPGPLADILGSYGGFLGDRLAGNPGAALAALPAAALDLADWCAAMLLPGVGVGPRWVIGTVLVVVGGVGWVGMFRRSRTVALTVVALAGVLWLWPFVDRRLMVPLVPWLVLGLVLGAGRLLAWAVARSPTGEAGRGAGLGALPVLGVGVWAAWFAATSVGGLARGVHEADYRFRAPALAGGVESVVRAAPPEAVVGAPELWAALHLYTGRTVAPSAPFRPGVDGAPAWGTPDEQIGLWNAAGIDHVLLEHGGRVHGAALDHLTATCPDAVQILTRYEGGLLVGLNRAGCPLLDRSGG